MKTDSKLIALLWTVIIVLVIGATVGAIMLIRHADALDTENSLLNGSNDSLRRQLIEAKTTPTPTVAPLPTPDQSTPTPTPPATPRPTATPRR